MSKQRLNEIEKKIAEKPVFVISKSYCPFCNKAKQVLNKYKIKPENIEIMEIDNDQDCNEIQVINLSIFMNHYINIYVKLSSALFTSNLRL